MSSILLKKSHNNELIRKLVSKSQSNRYDSGPKAGDQNRVRGRVKSDMSFSRCTSQCSADRLTEMYCMQNFLLVVGVRKGGRHRQLRLPGFRVKDGLSCVLFGTIALQKTRNLALP